jgi:hypothetical protein
MEEVKTTKEGEVETGLPGIVDKIMDYEHGNMSEEEMIDFFQKMLDSGLVWQLQGHYHRTAQALLEAGLIKRRTKEAKGESPPIMKFRNIEEGEN